LENILEFSLWDHQWKIIHCFFTVLQYVVRLGSDRPNLTPSIKKTLNTPHQRVKGKGGKESEGEEKEQ
jgi:hypothetical protein